MHGLANSGLYSNRQLCRAVYTTAMIVCAMMLSGCVASGPRTIETSKLLGPELGELAATSYAQLNLDDELLSDALYVKAVIASLVVQDGNLNSIQHASDYQSSYQTVSVSRATVDRFGAMLEPASINWVNSETGSQGRISSLKDVDIDDEVCRAFTTSRLSYNGVRNYKGLACQILGGSWTLKRFEAEI